MKNTSFKFRKLMKLAREGKLMDVHHDLFGGAPTPPGKLVFHCMTVCKGKITYDHFNEKWH